MKSLVRLFLYISIGCVVLSSCDKVDNEIKVGSPIGLWERMITSTDTTAFKGELRFHSNNSFDFIVLDTATSHSDTHGGYMTSANVIEFEDGDCTETGSYQYAVDTSRLTIVAVSDACYQRKQVLQGVWYKK